MNAEAGARFNAQSFGFQFLMWSCGDALLDVFSACQAGCTAGVFREMFSHQTMGDQTTFAGMIFLMTAQTVSETTN